MLRIAVLVLVSLFTVSRAASAGVISATGENSHVYYGDFATYIGTGLIWHSTDDSTHLIAEFVVETTPLASSSIGPSESVYRYDGGTFTMFYETSPPNLPPPEAEGFFRAPIYDLTITIKESALLFDEVTASVTLGAGLFDAYAATALGIGRRTRGGSVFDPYLFRVVDPAEEYAREGVPTVELVVPEPTSLVLFGVSGVCLLARRRWRRR